MGMRRLGLRAIGLGLTILLLAGCGGDDPGTPTPAPVVESGQMTPVISTSTPTEALPTVTSKSTARPTPVILPEILPAALYFLQDGQIQRLESDGDTLTQFTQETDPITDFDVSPVDARLVYVSGNRLIEANPQYGTEIVKLDGGPFDETDSAAWITQRISSPYFSPDGSQITFGLNGVNLIPAGDATEYTTILASDPYPDPNNPPRSLVRFYNPFHWSPDGTKLAVFMFYWPEGGDIVLLDLDTTSLIEITRDDPNATICCQWSWGDGGSIGFITSGEVFGPAYLTPGLTQVDTTDGKALPLVIGVPLTGPSPENPIRGFLEVFQRDDGTLLSFVSSAQAYEQRAPYILQSVAADGSLITPIGENSFSALAEVLWASDGSGAAVRTWGVTPEEQNQLFWVSSDGEVQQLPARGEKLRWAPVISRDNRQAAAESERADSASTETGRDTPSNPIPADDAPQLSAQITLNLRSGPGTLYPVVGSLNPDESVAIAGVSPDHTWWQVAITTTNSATAWVIGDANFVTTQNVADVAVVIPPPPPAPIGRLFFPGRDVNGNRAILVQELAANSTTQLVVSSASQPNLSADGTLLAVHSVRSDLLGIGAWNSATAEMTGLTSHPEDTLPTWSPNGDAIVFASTRHGDRRWRVYVQPNAFGELVREIAFGLDPNWHPSADRIAYKGCDVTGESCGIWTMDSQGGQQQPVTNDKSDSRPVWSPTGQILVFMSESRNGNWELYSVDPGGNAVTRLTNNPANDGLPVVSPDGRQIAFVSNRGGEWGVWVMPIGGGSPERLLRLGTDLPNWLEQSIDWTR